MNAIDKYTVTTFSWAGAGLIAAICGEIAWEMFPQKETVIFICAMLTILSAIAFATAPRLGFVTYSIVAMTMHYVMNEAGVALVFGALTRSKFAMTFGAIGALWWIMTFIAVFCAFIWTCVDFQKCFPKDKVDDVCGWVGVFYLTLPISLVVWNANGPGITPWLFLPVGAMVCAAFIARGMAVYYRPNSLQLAAMPQA